MRRRPRLLLLAAVVLLAGCELPVGAGPTPSGTVTPAPIPADGGLAPGITEAGVENPAALAGAHGRALSNRTYAVESARSVRSVDGNLLSRVNVTVRVGRGGAYRTSVATAGAAGPVFLGRPPARGDFWSNGTDYLAAVTRGGNTSYSRFRPPDGYAGTRVYWIRTVALGASPSRDVARTVAPFETTVEATGGDTGGAGSGPVVVTGADPGTTAFVDRPDHRNVTDARLRATVAPSGLVRSYELTYAATTADGTRVRVTRRVAYRNVGNATAARPAWADRAQ